MDILGVGGWELLAILLIMVVVAGPKRMIAWSYQLGRYVGVIRKMWVETAKQLQKEFDAAGWMKVPQELPTRQSIAKEIRRRRPAHQAARRDDARAQGHRRRCAPAAHAAQARGYQSPPRPNRSAPRRHPPKRMATARAAAPISAHGPAATANSNKPFLN
ncbi:MAG: hypothetical protein IPK17_21835 [Chloroflexi bacterium]|uniref:Sec-independent protein translocase subunit TatA/TatB n=1 Tax=Candidatus Flexifilum breve TaxID=3140694 RepID=UPI00313723F7|nr:hypothetical protein [Chloroflexota bacterium]